MKWNYVCVIGFWGMFFETLAYRKLEPKKKTTDQECYTLQEPEELPHFNQDHYEELIDHAIELYENEGEERFKQFLSIQHQIYKENEKIRECSHFRGLLLQRLLVSKITVELYHCSCVTDLD